MKDFPDFLGIGAQKAGTTWLYENLKEHPDIGFPPMKEVHFWDIYRDRGLDWYRQLFSALPQRIKGEITPAYAILPQESIAEAKALNPSMKLIYIIRDPIERAWSAALMDMERAGLSFDNAPDQWFIDHFNSEGSLKRGDYQGCIKNWLKFFPREQILILRHEEIVNEPIRLLKRCLQHIGASLDLFDPSQDKITRRIFAGSHHQLRPVLRHHLEQLYVGKLEELDKFLSQLDK